MYTTQEKKEDWLKETNEYQRRDSVTIDRILGRIGENGEKYGTTIEDSVTSRIPDITHYTQSQGE